jgi:tRNA/tmRNA/rRNA uracil-C5-methylase (TrmA/RlmC/RlmD family)
MKTNIEIEIVRTAFGGDGIGMLDGKTCFVEGALPGETVIARVLQDKKSYLRARVVKVLVPSESRAVPPCPYVERCGGCQYQHVSYEEELRLKEAQLRDFFERSLGAAGSVMKSIRRSPGEYGSRNSVTLHRTRPEDRRPQRLGFVSRDNKSMVAVDNCLLADPRLMPVFRAEHMLPKGKDRMTFRLTEQGIPVSDKEEAYPRIKIGGESLVAGSRGFFQNNLAVTGLLTEQVAAWARRFSPANFFDLYAGVGTFTFLSARDVPNIFCIEESAASLAALRMNRQEKRPQGIEIVEGRVEKAFPLVLPRAKKGGVMLCLDPPRAGLEASLTRFIAAQTGIDQIVYVSCDPATLVRDLKTLLAGGRYALAEAVPFDMFPRTKHVETAALLVRAEGR